MRAALLALAVLASCAGDDTAVPVRVAPASRHVEVESTLAREARAYAFADGDWLEDAGEAPFYGLAWLARRGKAGLLDEGERTRQAAALARAQTLLAGAPTAESVMAAFGLVAHVAVTGDRSSLAALDGFLDRTDAELQAAGDYLPDTTPGALAHGATTLTAAIALLEAEAALALNETRRVERVRAIDRAIVARALNDLADPISGRLARAYQRGPGQAGMFELPNAAMVLLKARLFRLTKDEAYRLQARATFSALGALRTGGEPARYRAVAAGADLALPSTNLVALAALLMFEITGEQRFCDEADSIVDGAGLLRGPYCAGERCADGLVDARTGDVLATTFDSGANLQTLFVIGYRRLLAGEIH